MDTSSQICTSNRIEVAGFISTNAVDCQSFDSFGKESSPKGESVAAIILSLQSIAAGLSS